MRIFGKFECSMENKLNSEMNSIKHVLQYDWWRHQVSNGAAGGGIWPNWPLQHSWHFFFFLTFLSFLLDFGSPFPLFKLTPPCTLCVIYLLVILQASLLHFIWQFIVMAKVFFPFFSLYFPFYPLTFSTSQLLLNGWCPSAFIMA